MKKYLAIYGKPRYLGIVSCEEEFAKADRVVVESTRGEDIAIIVGQLDEKLEADYRAIKTTIDRGENVPKTVEPAVSDLKFICTVGNRDLNEQGLFRVEERNILKKAKELVLPHKLDMKLIDVELLRGRQKLFIYFSAEQRVDFRAYVRDLAKEFKTRIELRQIGVRDEARIVGGLGMCGQPCCCSYWLHEFEPVGIKMVKEQNLALNPTKISGICGRLMCCICYEHQVYRELWEGLPSVGAKIKAASGIVSVTGIDIGAKALRCYIPNLGDKNIPISKFEAFEKLTERETDADAFIEAVKNLTAEDTVSPLAEFDMNIFKTKNERSTRNVQAQNEIDEHSAHNGKKNKKVGHHQKRGGKRHNLKHFTEQNNA